MYHYLAIWAVVAFIIFKAVNYVLFKRHLAGAYIPSSHHRLQHADVSSQPRPKSLAPKSLRFSRTVASEA